MSEHRFPTHMMCDGELLAAFEPTARATDVFVATPPKCGQTWLLALLHHLRTGGRDPAFGGVGALGATPWLENLRDVTAGGALFDRDARLAHLAGMADPRVFKLHVAFDHVPRPPGVAKVVTISRDVRDVPYSMFHHIRSLRPEIRGPSKADESFDAWFDTWYEGTSYYRIVASFWPHRDDPDVLWLRYEDMKADLRREARRLVDFLGWSVDADAFDRACALSDLAHMQKTESVMGFDRAFREPFVREGAVGKNRARLSPEQEARVVARARDELDPACYAFVMAHGD